MAHIVFLRAVNVGGKNVFRPAQLARALTHLDVVNIGAAGTFVVRARTTSAEIEREIARRLPFECEMMVRPARDIRTIVGAMPFAGVAFTRDVRGWVGALAAKPKASLDVPYLVPNRKEWALRVDRVEGRYAFGIWRRTQFVVPSNELEKALGVRVTVRWWETFERIARVMDGGVEV